jgi:hypothetical protein
MKSMRRLLVCCATWCVIATSISYAQSPATLSADIFPTATRLATPRCPLSRWSKEIGALTPAVEFDVDTRLSAASTVCSLCETRLRPVSET